MEPERTRRERALERAEQLKERAAVERTRHRSVDVVFDAAERDGEVGGGLLAGALAYRLFIWLLPFAFVVVAGLGIAADASGETPGQAAERAGLGGLVTSSISSAAKSSSRWYAVLIGIPILVWTTRSLLRGLLTAHRLVWAEGRGTVPKPTWVATLRLLALLVVMFAVPSLVRAVRDHTDLGAILILLLDWTVFGVLWLLVELEMPHRSAPWRALVPGALLFGVGIQLLSLATALFLVPWAEGKEGTYGALGLAAALLLALFFISRLMVAAAVLNATLWERRATSPPPEVPPPPPA